MKRMWGAICLAAIIASMIHAEMADSPWKTTDDGLGRRLVMGDPKAKDVLGFGWQARQRLFNRYVRWISRLEADVQFTLDEVSDQQFTIKAAPQYLIYRRQNIGLYINGRYVHEWTCPDDPAFETYSTVIPAERLNEGENLLTLRMGYRRRQLPDRRELSLAVVWMELEPVAGDEVSAGETPTPAPE